MLIIWMGRLCFWAILVWAVFAPGPFSYGPFLHVGRFGMAVFVWDDLVSGPTSPESVYTDRHQLTHRQTDTHTDGHEYSIVVVDKPQQ